MPSAVEKLARLDARKAPRKRELPALNPEERAALRKLRAEARAQGAVLANAGRGGLPPSLVLGVLRRDGYQCKVCGDRGEGEHGGLVVHHKGGIPVSRWLQAKGKANEPNNIVTVCTRGHRAMHEQHDEET